MNKESLLEILDDVWNIHLLGTAGSILYLSEKGLELLKNTSLSTYGRTQDLQKLAESMKDKRQKGNAIVKFNHALRDHVLREPFNYVKEYCEESNQKPLLEMQKWYKFARILRNYLSHGKQFDLKRYPEKDFPIKWKNNVIKWSNMQQNQIDFNSFEHTMVLELFEEIQKFAKNLK